MSRIYFPYVRSFVAMSGPQAVNSNDLSHSGISLRRQSHLKQRIHLLVIFVRRLILL